MQEVFGRYSYGLLEHDNLPVLPGRWCRWSFHFIHCKSRTNMKESLVALTKLYYVSGFECSLSSTAQHEIWWTPQNISHNASVHATVRNRRRKQKSAGVEIAQAGKRLSGSVCVEEVWGCWGGGSKQSAGSDLGMKTNQSEIGWKNAIMHPGPLQLQCFPLHLLHLLHKPLVTIQLLLM